MESRNETLLFATSPQLQQYQDKDSGHIILGRARSEQAVQMYPPSLPSPHTQNQQNCPTPFNSITGMAAVIHEPATRPACSTLNLEEEEEAIQPVIVLTDCAKPFRIIGVSANWTETFGTSTPEIVGRGINVVFGPETDVKTFYSVLKSANLSISIAVAATLYNKSGQAKRFTIFGKESDVISPPACELFIYPTETLRHALTHNAKLVVSSEEPYVVKSESGKHLEMACLDIIGRPLLDLYSSCDLNVTRLRAIVERTAVEHTTCRETLWNNIDVRVCTHRDAAGLILLELAGSSQLNRNAEPAGKLASLLAAHRSSPEPDASHRPSLVNVLLQEGRRFPYAPKEDVSHFVRMFIGDASAESKAKADASPLWNEMHQLPLAQLPATVRLEVVARCSEIDSVVATTEFKVMDAAATGYCDEWVDLAGASGRPSCRIRVALSCHARHLEQLKQGLYPSGAPKFVLKSSATE